MRIGIEAQRIFRTKKHGMDMVALELIKNPFIGQKEDLLSDRIQEFRYIVFKNYKIIYWIDEVNKKILVSHVFDTRQNPDKINRF